MSCSQIKVRRSTPPPPPSQGGEYGDDLRTMKIDRNDTALVVIDPQNDVLSEDGVSWALVGDSVKENDTVANIERLFRAAKDRGFGVFISPHYLYPFDQAWQFGGPVEQMMLEGKEFSRP